MSHPIGLTDYNQAQTFIGIAADVMIALGSGISGLNIYCYGRDKADRAARQGCYAVAALLIGVAILEVTDLWAISMDVQGMSVVVKVIAAVMAVVMAAVLSKTTPGAPNLKTARVIEEQNSALEQENKILLESRNRAFESVELKTAFLASISHELRSQLSAVFGMNELLLHTHGLDEDQHMLVLETGQAAQTLLATINDLHDLAKIDTGMAVVELVPMSVSAVVREACSLCSEPARRKKLFVTTDIDPAIPSKLVGDAKRIRQILLNLMRNAINFTEKGGIIIQATLENQSESQLSVRFYVKDTGLGLTDDEQKTFFDAFGSGSQTRGSGHTGIGLYISKRLVDTMGGTMGVDSRRGQGSCFWFEVPFSAVEETGLEPGSPAGLSLPADAVALVAEDDPTLLALTLRQLKTLGISAVGVGTGHEAIEFVSRSNIDVIFMDCHLPHLDGFEATRAIRQLELQTGRHVPIIAMTADVVLSDAERCRRSGMDDYLSKPVSIEDLQSKLKQWLANKISIN